MDWLVYPLRDLLVWSFENLLEPVQNSLNNIFLFLMLFGIVYWLMFQHKLNKKAEAEGQIK